MFIHSNLFRRKLRSFFYRAFCWLENNNNTNFQQNGEGEFLDAALSRLAKLHTNPIEIFDIGANRGDYSRILNEKLFQHRLNAQIHVFEPTQGCFELLKTQYGTQPNVVLNRVAVSDINGTAQIYYDHQQSMLASLYPRNLAAQGITLNQTEPISTIRLDDYIRQHQIHHIHILKIDVEGHELPAFKGMSDFLNEAFVDFVQFEYGGANLDSHTSLLELYALFEARGFTIGKVMPSGIELRPYHFFMENFQYANYVAVSNHVLAETT